MVMVGKGRMMVIIERGMVIVDGHRCMIGVSTTRVVMLAACRADQAVVTFAGSHGHGGESLNGNRQHQEHDQQLPEKSHGSNGSTKSSTPPSRLRCNNVTGAREMPN